MLLEQGVHKTPEEGREFARSIREAAELLLGVINDLLDLAKVAAGRFELRLIAGDVRPAVQSALEAIGPLAARKGLNLLVDIPMEPLDVTLDPARMRQVLLNLLGNAVKFTEKGEVRIRAWRDETTEEARVLIEDTGVGIAPEHRARLFKKFSQVDSSYRRRHSGTGLGLVITQALVKNMGGTVTVESEGLNQGTRVTLAFPALIGSRDEVP
jgi:signal transduction histidine kinase